MPSSFRRLTGALALALAPLAAATAQVWENRNHLLVDPVGAQAGALFGYASAVGDFDGDGYDDLAVSAPYRDLPIAGGTTIDAGILYFYRGGPAGLASAAWTSVELPFFDDTRYGFALVARDFDDDGRDEIAVGAPGSPTIGPPFVAATGLVEYLDYDLGSGVFLGTVFGTFSCGCETDEANDQFGATLAAGDFDFDGFAELVVGVPFEDRGAPAAIDGGVVVVFQGSAAGPFDITTPPLWSEERGGWLGAQSFAEFGAALTTGFFDFDSYEDLAIGEPGRNFAGGLAAAGRVRVLYGSAAGLVDAGSQSVDGASTGVGRQAGERFGEALAAEDFDFPGVLLLCLFGACIDELAIGAPGHAVGAAAAAGRVVVVPGTPDGLDLAAATSWTQAQLGGAASEVGDRFGARLAAREMDGRSGAELAVGSPYEDLADADQGLVHLLFGGPDGLGSHAPQSVDARPGFAVAPGQAADFLGWSLAAGDFDGDGAGDLAVGVPGDAVAGQAAAGAVQVLYGALFADGFERGSSGGWSLLGP